MPAIMHPTCGRLPGRSETPLNNTTFDRSHAPAWERRPGRSSVTKPAAPFAGRRSFLCLPKEKNPSCGLRHTTAKGQPCR